MAAPSRIAVQVDAQELTATATIEPGPPEPPEALNNALEQAGVLHGVDSDACDRVRALLSEPDSQIPTLIVAQGTPAVDGHEEHLELVVDAEERAATVRANGTLDFRSHGTLCPVHTGRVVARLCSAVTGEPGVSVRGEPLPANTHAYPKPAALGNGVGLRPNGDIVAQCGGILVFHEGKSLDVAAHYQHKGPIDNRSGHLESGGTLVVSGDVARGFGVAASSGLQIKGSVEGGCAYSRGELNIARGVLGSETSIVSGLTVVSLGHVQFGLVEAGVKLTVERTTLNSQLHAPQVEVGGAVVGGRIQAETRISVHDVGSKRRTRTRLWVGEPMPSPLECELEPFSVSTALQVASHKRGSTWSAADAARRARGEPKLDPNERRRMKEEARQRRRELVAAAQIVIQGTGHPGVEIRIGEHTRILDHLVRNVVFSLDPETAEIRMDQGEEAGS